MATAIVLAGAGARGAYEAGVLSVVLPKLLESEREVVVVGTSAGAINAALLGATAHASPADISEILRDVWCNLDREQVFNVRWRRIFPYVLDVITVGRTPGSTHGLLDTLPLETTIDGNPKVDWNNLRANVGATWVKSLGVVATQISTGTSVVFVQGPSGMPDNDPARGIVYERAELDGKHVRASAAIPIAFPSVRIDGRGWFADGGIRLNTPIRPAIDLLSKLGAGKKRVMIIATHPDPRKASQASSSDGDQPDIIDEAASILHSIFVDRIAEDVQSLRRVNSALRATGQTTVATPHRARKTLDVIEHAYFGPPRDGLIAQAAQDTFELKYREWSLDPFSMISRFLGGRGKSRDELLSFLFFDRDYLKGIFDLGRDHAREATSRGIEWLEVE